MGHEPSLETVDDKGRTDLHHAATLNLPALTTSLLHSGVDVNAEDQEKMTPLHLVAMRDALDAARVLRDSGADVNAKDKDDLTPLHLATMRNVFRIAELLLEHGADVNAKNSDGWTPLFIATRKKDGSLWIAGSYSQNAFNLCGLIPRRLRRSWDTNSIPRCLRRGNSFSGSMVFCWTFSII